MSRLPEPVNGRLVGFAITVITVAMALRVAWAVVQPIAPLLVSLLALAVLYRVIVRGRRH
jgi:hypothetical protein